MPLSRYLVRNEYGLADPDLYRVADKDDPEALLEGVAMAGLVGVLRQLGDLAEFAAEMFHDLHEEVMATAARGHSLIARVQQLEAEFPSAENTLLSQTTHIPFLYSSGIDWHPNIRIDENLVTQGDMPRFVMDSYEECRGPPRLFLLDKFDVAGAGACLKRYTDPSFCKAESTDFSIKKSEGQREKRIRKLKRRGQQWRNGDTPEFSSSHAKLHQLLLEERIETGANDPERRVKLKKRPLDGFTREDRLKSYMQKFMDTYSSDTKVVREISLDLVPVNVESYNDNCHSGLEIVEYDTFSPSREPFYEDKGAYSSFNIPEAVKPSINEFNEVTDGRAEEIHRSYNGAFADNLSSSNKDVTEEELAADTSSKSGGSVGEYNGDDIASEIDNYVDALATLESETETDSDYRTKRDQRLRNGVNKMIDSDGSEEKHQQNLFLDYHSRGNSTISDDGSLLKKDIDVFSSSENISNSVEEATAKSSVAGPANFLEDDENSVNREAQGNYIEDYIASDVAESMGVVKSEYKELPWISVNVGSAFTESDNGIQQTDQESNRQAVVNTVPHDGYDHSMSARISPVIEMADASSDSSYDVLLGHSLMSKEISTHPQPEYSRNGRSNFLTETKSSPASSPAKSINDLTQPVETTSDAFDFPEPVYVPCEDNGSTQINEKRSEDQPCLPGVSQVHEQPKGADYSELMEPIISVATDTDGIVEPRASIAANSEDSLAAAAAAVEPLCFGNFESTEQLEFDSSEYIVANPVDESRDGRTYMNGDESSNSDLVVNPSQIDTQSDQDPDVPDAPQLFDSSTIANMEGSSKLDSINKVERVDAIRNHDDCIATYQDQPGPAPASSSDSHLAYEFADITHEKDATISSQTIAADYPSEILPEVRKAVLDLNQSVQVLDHAETEDVSARHNCLNVENPETEREFLSVGDDPYHNCEGSQVQPLRDQFEADLQNPVTCERDDCVNTDSTACDTSSTVLRSANNVSETCLEDSQIIVHPTSLEEASVECDQHLIKNNTCQYHEVEDEEHILDKTVETLGVEITEKSVNLMEGISQPLEYAEQILPVEDSGNEKCINPISVSSLSAPQSLAADLSVQLLDFDYRFKSQLEEAEALSFSVSASPPRKPLVPEVLPQSVDHKLQNNWPAMSPPLFGTSPIPNHVAPGEMPPLPPLPPIQWRLGRNQQTSLAFGGLMQHPFGTLQSSVQRETSDNAGLTNQNSSMAQNLNPFLSSGFSDDYLQQPTDSMPPTTNMSHEDGQQNNITLDQGQDTQIFTGSENDLSGPALPTHLDNFSFEPLESRLMTDDATSHSPAFFKEVMQKEATVANDQFEHTFSPAEQETAVLNEQLEHIAQNDMATTSVQFEPVAQMQYGNQLSHGFSDPEAQGMWSADVFSARKPENANGSLQKKIQRPRNPLIDAVVAVDKSKLRKVGEIVKLQDKPEAETKDQHLPQLRKVGKRVKAQDKSKAETREQPLPQLRKVGERVKPQDAVKDEETSQNFPQLRKIGERVKHQDSSSPKESLQHLPSLRKVEKRIKPQDEPKDKDETQSLLPLRGVGERPKTEDESQTEKRDWLEQIRNKSVNLKPATTSRPNIQGHQTNLQVAAILEKASMIRLAMAGNDDDSDGWSDC